MKATGIVRRIDECVKLGLNPANPVISRSSADFIHILAVDGLMLWAPARRAGDADLSD